MTAVAASVPDRRTNSGPAHPVQDSPAYKVYFLWPGGLEWESRGMRVARSFGKYADNYTRY